MRTACYLAHCLLNANAKVDEGARCQGVSSPVLALLRDHDCTIRQMPCPELAFGGTSRFWAVREQYDTPVYRAHCRRLAEPVAAQIRADVATGARVIVIGIDGSPSMGVELTAASPEWGGRPDKPRDEDYPVTPGRGLFMETLMAAVEERGIEGVRFTGIAQDTLDYDEAAELARLDTLLGAA